MWLPGCCNLGWDDLLRSVEGDDALHPMKKSVRGSNLEPAFYLVRAHLTAQLGAP